MQPAARLHRSKSRPPEQVWLPGLQVWAAIGQTERTAVPGAASPQATAASTDHLRSCSTGEKEHMQSVQSVQASCSKSLNVIELLQTEATVIAEDDHPTCPICRHLHMRLRRQWVFGARLLDQQKLFCRLDRNCLFATQSSPQQLHACLLC